MFVTYKAAGFSKSTYLAIQAEGAKPPESYNNWRIVHGFTSTGSITNLVTTAALWLLVPETDIFLAKIPTERDAGLSWLVSIKEYERANS